MAHNFIPGCFDISTEIDGNVFNGYYTEEKNMITVYYKDFSESAQKSISNNDILAKVILGQLVRNHKND